MPLLPLILYAIASLWIHTVAPHKFIGHAVIVVMVLGGLDMLGWRPSLFVEFARAPNPVYSDMNQYEPYWRPHNSKPGGGLGLGLYICAQIARAHGGELTVRSAADSGTGFEARLPIVLAR